jgi:hypothetical protein
MWLYRHIVGPVGEYSSHFDVCSHRHHRSRSCLHRNGPLTPWPSVNIASQPCSGGCEQVCALPTLGDCSHKHHGARPHLRRDGPDRISTLRTKCNLDRLSINLSTSDIHNYVSTEIDESSICAGKSATRGCTPNPFPPPLSAVTQTSGRECDGAPWNPQSFERTEAACANSYSHAFATRLCDAPHSKISTKPSGS